MPKCPRCGFVSVTRSNSQNKMYWSAYIEPMAESAGCTPEEMHDALKDELLSQQIIVKTVNGIEFKRIVGSTTEMKTKEFSDYLEKVAEIASRVYGIVIQQ